MSSELSKTYQTGILALKLVLTNGYSGISTSLMVIMKKKRERKNVWLTGDAILQLQNT